MQVTFYWAGVSIATEEASSVNVGAAMKQKQEKTSMSTVDDSPVRPRKAQNCRIGIDPSKVPVDRALIRNLPTVARDLPKTQRPIWTSAGRDGLPRICRTHLPVRAAMFAANIQCNG